MGARQGRRATLVAVALSFVVSLALASPAAATSCANLQAALTTSSPGDTITLDAGVTCNTGNATLPFTLPSHQVTLNGNGATIDATGATNRALDGIDIGATTVQGLTIQNSSFAGNGGAVGLSGASFPVFQDVKFLANHATGTNSGGAVYVTPSTGAGTIKFLNCEFGDGTSQGANTAGYRGGAIMTSGNAPVLIQGSRFNHNSTSFAAGAVVNFGGDLTVMNSSFTDNAATGSFYEGGAAIEVHPTGTTTISGSTFSGNHVTASPVAQQTLGGAVVIESGGDPAPAVHLDNNLFQNNSISGGSPTQYSPQGAGISLYGVATTSRNDRFVGNTLGPGQGTGKSWGAGVSVIGCQGSGASSATFENAVIAGNVATGSAAGAGVYVGCADGPAHLTLRNSTVAGNSAGGDTAGVWGGGDDTLDVVSSILAGNSGGADLVGFNTRNVTYSDVCFSGVAHPGTGNICAAAALVNPAGGDVHETSTSPTIDLGSNADVPSDLLADFEGNARITDGDGSGTATVDMGADESPAVAPSTPPGGGETAPPPPPSGTATPQPTATTNPPAPFSFKVSQGAGGVLTLTFTAPGPGLLEALGSYAKGASAAALKLGKGQVLYARVTKRTTSAGRVVIKLKPGKNAKRALAKRKKLVIRIVTRFSPTTGKPVTKTKTVKVLAKRPR